MYAELIAAFAGCAAGAFAGHYFTVHSLSVYFDEIHQRINPAAAEVRAEVVHASCDFCKSVVARYEVIAGKIKCANCKGEGK